MQWKIGYWYWKASWWSVDARNNDSEGVQIDLLYVHAGEYRSTAPKSRHESFEMHWPDQLPKADAFFAVFRCEGTSCADEAIIPGLIKEYEILRKRTDEKGQKLVGLQIDYDSPTNDLERYGRFLRGLRTALNKNDQISITCLLDWFRPGTNVAEVIRWTDEFIPQFYDIDQNRLVAPDGGIAEPVDPAKWAPIFNAFSKPYRIGISSFGRILQVPGPLKVPNVQAESKYVFDRTESPIEVLRWKKGGFIYHSSTPAGEVISHNKGLDNKLNKMVIPTQKSVSAAYNAAKAMGGYCSGVVFFRHQIGNEALVLSPVEISGIIYGRGSIQPAASVDADYGFCAVVSCSDLFVRLRDRFPSQDVVLTVQSSQDLEYIVKDRLIDARLRGPRLIEVRIPAYAGTPKIRIGRVVSRDPVRFLVEISQ